MNTIRIPRRFLRIAPQKSTKTLRGKGGLFRGRVSVNKGGDSTRSVQFAQDYDANHDGKIGRNEHGGQVVGRENIKVRASSRARGYERRV